MIDGRGLKTGGICKSQEEKMMKWFTKIRNNLKRMTKEDPTENCPKNQENHEFKHAPHSSGRKKTLKKMSWRRVPRQILYPKCVFKTLVITSQNRTV